MQRFKGISVAAGRFSIGAVWQRRSSPIVRSVGRYSHRVARHLRSTITTRWVSIAGGSRGYRSGWITRVRITTADHRGLSCRCSKHRRRKQCALTHVPCGISISTIRAGPIRTGRITVGIWWITRRWIASLWIASLWITSLWITSLWITSRRITSRRITSLWITVGSLRVTCLRVTCRWVTTRWWCCCIRRGWITGSRVRGHRRWTAGRRDRCTRASIDGRISRCGGLR